MSATRVLPADVYDTLELAAEAFGGVGANFMFHGGDFHRPCCAHGLAAFAQGGIIGPMTYTLFDFGISGEANDIAVYAINARKDPGGYNDTPVSFAAWCAELGVVRGDS